MLQTLHQTPQPILVKHQSSQTCQATQFHFSVWKRVSLTEYRFLIDRCQEIASETRCLIISRSLIDTRHCSLRLWLVEAAIAVYWVTLSEDDAFTEEHSLGGHSLPYHSCISGYTVAEWELLQRLFYIGIIFCGQISLQLPVTLYMDSNKYFHHTLHHSFLLKIVRLAWFRLVPGAKWFRF